MKLRAIFLLLIGLLFSQQSFSQRKLIEKQQHVIDQAIQNAYPACVRMWGFNVQQNQRTSAQFSGVVVTADGYILTAAHTTIPGTNYKVFFPDGRDCIAVALGRIDNPSTPGMPDVGMMKIIDKGKWPFAAMGNSAGLKSNEFCVSIAYPESLNLEKPTVRIGIIAEGRNNYGFIRSTCKMEPGDSGGPLFDYLGRVIGLHSAIDVPEDQNFEIPVNLYRKYWNALMQEKTYTSFPDSDSSSVILPAKNTEKLILTHQLQPIEKNKNSCFVISSSQGGTIQQILATLINKKIKGINKQFLISKNTEVGENPSIVAYPEAGLKICVRDVSNDLILMELANPVKGGVDLSDPMLTPFSIGKLLFSSMPNHSSIVGAMSTLELSLPKITSQAYLGAMVMFNSQPAQFSLIKANSPASRAGIRVGDELLQINSKQINHAKEFAPEMLKVWPNESIALSWKSGNQTHTENILLEAIALPNSKHPADKFSGGKSLRRDGLESIFIQDATIKSNECGSPVFDGDGRFYGINIARYSRTATVVMPVLTLNKLFAEIL